MDGRQNHHRDEVDARQSRLRGGGDGRQSRRRDEVDAESIRASSDVRQSLRRRDEVDAESIRALADDRQTRHRACAAGGRSSFGVVCLPLCRLVAGDLNHV